MKVVILCGGQGTRLREETEYRPKPMVQVGERPLLWHIMKNYARCGHTDFVLCLGYRGEIIKEYFLTYEAMLRDCTVTLGQEGKVAYHGAHGEAGWNVTLAETGLHALTGARVKRIQRYIGDEPFLLTYGDGLISLDINAVIDFHRSEGRLATLTGVHAPGRFGELTVNGHEVKSFLEKPEASGGYINGGYFVCEPAVFDYLSADENCILEREPLERLAADGQLSVYKHDGFWQCVDTFRDYKLVNELWSQGDAPWKTW